MPYPGVSGYETTIHSLLERGEAWSQFSCSYLTLCACAARVLYCTWFVCLSVDDYSRTTGYEERYQQLQCYKRSKSKMALGGANQLGVLLQFTTIIHLLFSKEQKQEEKMLCNKIDEISEAAHQLARNLEVSESKRHSEKLQCQRDVVYPNGKPPLLTTFKRSLAELSKLIKEELNRKGVKPEWFSGLQLVKGHQPFTYIYTYTYTIKLF